jgi:ankyrin repeat protein
MARPQEPYNPWNPLILDEDGEESPQPLWQSPPSPDGRFTNSFARQENPPPYDNLTENETFRQTTDVASFTMHSMPNTDSNVGASKWAFNMKHPCTFQSDEFVNACMRGHTAIVKAFLKNGVDPTVRENIAVRWAARRGHREIVEELVKYGADLKAKNMCALRWAIAAQKHDVADFINHKIHHKDHRIHHSSAVSRTQ